MHARAYQFGYILSEEQEEEEEGREEGGGGIRVDGEEKMKEKVGKEGRVKDDEEEEEEESDRAEHNGAKTGKRYAHFPKKWSPE